MRDAAVKFRRDPLPYDPWLVGTCIVIIALGLVMVTSASITIAEQKHHQPFYFLGRQLVYLFLGLTAGAVVANLPLRVWEKLGPALLGISLILLLVVLTPLGKGVNGGSRWLDFGIVKVQVSEAVKLFFVIYLAGHLTKHAKAVRASFRGLLAPMLALSLVAVLLLCEPDYGTTVVISVIALGMFWLADVKLRVFGILLGLVTVALSTTVWLEAYRIKRLLGFIDPFKYANDKGFQLVQSLIALGRGEWTGVGLGDSVQKLFYLPEAYTDFVFAVFTEELGFLGALSVIVLYAVLAWRTIQIGKAAEAVGKPFGAYLAYGIGIWIAFQAYVNIGVNMGVLPTKGLTLPLISYGGSSYIITLIAVAILMRVHFETYSAARGGASGVPVW